MTSAILDRPSAYRLMTDQQLAAEAARLERVLDDLDAGYWPAASAQREETLERLSALRAEAERRAAV